MRRPALFVFLTSLIALGGSACGTEEGWGRGRCVGTYVVRTTRSVSGTFRFEARGRALPCPASAGCGYACCFADADACLPGDAASCSADGVRAETPSETPDDACHVALRGEIGEDDRLPHFLEVACPDRLDFTVKLPDLRTVEDAVALDAPGAVTLDSTAFVPCGAGPRQAAMFATEVRLLASAGGLEDDRRDGVDDDFRRVVEVELHLARTDLESCTVLPELEALLVVELGEESYGCLIPR